MTNNTIALGSFFFLFLSNFHNFETQSLYSLSVKSMAVVSAICPVEAGMFISSTAWTSPILALSSQGLPVRILICRTLFSFLDFLLKYGKRFYNLVVLKILSFFLPSFLGLKLASCV